MDINEQKRIKYIPVKNITTTWRMFLEVCRENGKGLGYISRTVIKMMFWLILINVIRVEFCVFLNIDIVTTILVYVTAYQNLYMCSSICIKEQEKMMNENSK